MITLSQIEEACAKAIVEASIKYEPEHREAFKRALEKETQANSKWLLGMILENDQIGATKKLPLCDDTGIPYVQIEIGEESEIEGNTAKILQALEKGLAIGLREVPGRPMAVKGSDFERIEQSVGLYPESEMLLASPIRVKVIPGKEVRVSAMMMGGGPEIRAKTYRIFHHHSLDYLTKEVSTWAIEMAKVLGCTPCVPAIGIGRTHYEATCLMLDAMLEGKFGVENKFEKAITAAVNASNVGPLGVGGDVTALQTFSKIGQQRASGVRIVCLRLGCIVDPRRATIII